MVYLFYSTGVIGFVFISVKISLLPMNVHEHGGFPTSILLPNGKATGVSKEEGSLRRNKPLSLSNQVNVRAALTGLFFCGMNRKCRVLWSLFLFLSLLLSSV